MNQPTGIETQIGLLHPGQMGVSIGRALRSAGHQVHWVSEGRSSETGERANSAGFIDAVTVGALCETCSVLVSVCPPDQSGKVADLVTANGYDGVYVDCNAISPDASRAVEQRITAAGGACVDGGIIGPPASTEGTTRLYLSGKASDIVAALFADSIVDAKVIGTDVGAASALKMAYAGWTKGSAALLMTQFAFARQQNVDAALLAEWALSLPDMAARLESSCTGNAPKAWRFEGEMIEIARSLEAAGLPRSWFDGAAEIYARLEGFKNRDDVEEVDVITALLPHDNA